MIRNLWRAPPNGEPAAAPRFALYFAMVFASVGIQMPFWSVWLKAQGLSAPAIGDLMALVLWVKIAAGPLIGHAADRSGRPVTVMLVLAAVTAAGFAGFVLFDGLFALVLLSVVTLTAFQALIPIGQSEAMAAEARGELDYGRSRLWGSVAFIAASSLGGLIVARYGIALVPALLVVLSLAGLAAVAGLPGRRVRGPSRPPRGAWRRLLGDRTFALFLAMLAGLQASHAVVLAFASIHWRALGHSAGEIGALWSTGVVAEIAVFAAGGWLVARLGGVGLLALGAAGAVARWAGLAFAESLPVLFALQALHGLTFGAAHLGAMRVLVRVAPAGTAATAQSLTAAVAGGAASAIGMALAGRLYEAWSGTAFLWMLLPAGLALCLCWPLARRVPRGGGPAAGS